MLSPKLPPSDSRHLPPVLDLVANVLLAGGVLTLLLLPSSVFPRVLRLVPLCYAVGYLLLRLWMARHGGAGPRSTGSRWQEWIQIAALLFIFSSLIPMSVTATRLHGDTRFSQNKKVAEALQTVEQLQLGESPASQGKGYALTRNKAGTIRVLLLLLAMHAAYQLSMLIPPQRRELQLWLLAFFGAAVAVAGIVSKHAYPQGHTLWWIFPTAGKSLPGPLACFVNPNHYAAYLAMLCPCALALTIGACQRRRLFSALIGTALLLVMVQGLLVSHSRGGLLAFAVGIVAVACLCLLRGRVLSALIIALLLGVMAFNIPILLSETYRERLSALLDLDADDSYRTRVQAWADSRQIIRQYPLLGAGANAFRMVFPQVRSESTQARMTHAENEYVQLLTDFGLFGAALFFCILTCMLWRMGKQILHRGRDLDVMALAATGSLAAIAAHATVDFALHIPHYALSAAVLLGVTQAAFRSEPTDAPRPSSSPMSLTPALILLALTLTVVLTWGRRQHLDSSSHIRRTSYAKLCRALRSAPTSPQVWQRLGQKALKENELDARLFGEACLTQAGIYDPKDYTLWYEIGAARLSLGDRQGARQAQKHVQSLKDWYWPEDLEVY